MAKQFNFGTYDQQHLRNLNARLKKIAQAYDEAVRHGCALGERTGFNDPEGEFDFHDYPEIKKQLDDLLKDLRANLGGIIKEGDREEWLLSCAKNDALVETINRTANFPKEALAQFKHQNMASLAAFQGRKVVGMGLSKRVWQLSDQFKGELELALELGLGEGKSADELSRDVRQYLREPAQLFRRVRDEKGALRLSKAAKAYHPGRGVYRSSYKNALRLTATENNMAYRTADHLRWQQLDFVLGIEIKLSNNHPCDDVCDELAGVYPKDFKFVGWHPFCRCFAVPKLAKPEDVADYSQRLADGEDVSDFEYPGKVEALPKKFTDWVQDNQERIDKAKSVPYFISDNEKYIQTAKSYEPLYESAISMPEEAFAKYVNGKDDFFILKGVNSYKSFINSHLAKFRFDEFIEDIKPELQKHSIDKLQCRASVGQGSFFIEGRGFELGRTFYIDENGRKIVAHDLFTLRKNLQGKGISKLVFRALDRQYKNMGVELIKVDANIDVGGYTWAKYGFYANNRDIADLAVQWGRLSIAESKEVERIMTEFYKNHSYDSPFPMHKIASLPLGKKALLGGQWEGVLDLQNPEQRVLWDKYLGV